MADDRETRGPTDRGAASGTGSTTSLDRVLPRVELALKEAGFTDVERAEWMLRLRSMLDVSEDEIVSLVEGSIAPHTHSYLMRQFNIWRHELARWWNHRNPLVRLIYGAGWLSVLLGAALKSGLSVWGYVSAGVVLLIKVWNAIKEFDPKHLPVLRRNRTERQLMLEKLLHTIQCWLQTPPNEREIEEFHKDTLLLIASYVRDHRSDLKGKKIFVNLLVVDKEELVVVARSDSRRSFPKRYRADECLVAWTAITEGTTQFSGDIYADCPNTPKGKPYNSVLVIPIKLDKRVVGGVSVDSAAKYHFDRYVDELQTELAPYVQLLAVTLAGFYGSYKGVTQLPLRVEGDHHAGYSDDS
jgi:hypothetical protein